MQITPKIPPNRSLTACYSLQAIDTVLYFTADVLSATDYYPFGMQMVGRRFIGVNYKYGFNSQEKDDDIYGTGNSYTAEYWQYDARLGRRWNVDPVYKHTLSNYSAFNNNPVLNIDPNGMEWVNAYDAKVAQIEKALVSNPDCSRLRKQLDDALKNQAIVNKIISNLKENDVALYNYIENLYVKDIFTGKLVSVKVTVSIDYSFGSRDDYEDAKIKYKNSLSNGKYYVIEYESLEGKWKTLPGPINSNDEIGFDITIHTQAEWSDVFLADEVGDVMFRMEYPDAASNTPTSRGLSKNQYLMQESTDYSSRVQETYKARKKSGEGKGPDNNPYPLEK